MIGYALIVAWFVLDIVFIGFFVYLALRDDGDD